MGAISNIYSHAWSAPVQIEEVGLKKDVNLFLNGYFGRKLGAVFFPLKGGHSDTKNYLLIVDATPYVLRVQNPKQGIEENRKELLIFEEAAKAGIAPKVYAVSPDFSYALIEYIHAPTLPFEGIKGVLPACAKTFSILHSLQIPNAKGNGQTLAALFIKLYEELKTRHKQIPEIDFVIEEIRKIDQAMQKMNISPVLIHGDLHPRNAFLNEGKVLFVDWELAAWDDPFHDLSYFSNCAGLEEWEEREFLEHYLQRNATPDEENRFRLSKIATLLFLSYNCFAQGYESAKENGELLRKDAPFSDWHSYLKGWAEKGEHPAQFFYDWGKQCLNQLNKISY